MMRIRRIRKKDFNTARKFALEGMHFKQYTSNKIELYFYSKYFWYLELTRATEALGAYEGDKLVGVLLTEMKNQPKIFKSRWHKAFIKLAEFIMNIGYKNAADPYDKANKQMLKAFHAGHKTDGELICFAADPRQKGKGIGTLLLNELERRESGKTIYLFTDSNCTYQFYSHRGFEQVGSKKISLEIKNRKIPLTCLLFSKRMGII